MAKAIINGYEYSHASYRATLYGLRIPIKAFGVKHAVDREEVRNNSRKPDAFTAGDWKGDVSLEVTRSVWDQVKAHCFASRGRAPLDCQGDFVLTYGERGMPSGTIQVKVAGLGEADGSSSQGNAASTVKLTPNVLDILENGVSLISAEEDY